jgi:hypothetical protein
VGEVAVPSFRGPTACTRLADSQNQIEKNSLLLGNNSPVTVDMDILNGEFGISEQAPEFAHEVAWAALYEQPFYRSPALDHRWAQSGAIAPFL